MSVWLHGKRILLLGTRLPSAAQITEHLDGAKVTATSPMVVVPRHATLKDAVARLSSVRAIAFASANAVDALMGALVDRGLDARALAGIRLAAIGAATAERLAERSLRADLVGHAGGAALAKDLSQAGWEGPILLPRAVGGRPDLADALVAAGIAVVVVDAYETVVDDAALSATARQHRQAPFHAVAVMSPRAGTALIDAWGVGAFAGVAVVAVGDTTRAALVDAGLPDTTAARTPDWNDVLAEVAGRFAIPPPAKTV